MSAYRTRHKTRVDIALVAQDIPESAKELVDDFALIMVLFILIVLLLQGGKNCSVDLGRFRIDREDSLAVKLREDSIEVNFLGTLTGLDESFGFKHAQLIVSSEEA